MSADKFYFDMQVMKDTRANVPLNIAQVARQTYDKYGTAFPCLDHSEWIDGIDISGNLFNGVYRSFGYAMHYYAFSVTSKRTRVFVWEYVNKIERMVDKMCQLKLI